MNIQQTKDGSDSVFHPVINECYHSIHGAISESHHVFLKEGLTYYHQNFPQKNAPIRILEMGFGTGLNALLTIIKGEKIGIAIDYTSTELYPLENSFINQLNYPKIIEGTSDIFNTIHELPFNTKKDISPNFSLVKLHQDWNKLALKNNQEIIYFDAFSPDKQPELWSESALQIAYSALVKNGIFVTYCAKGILKRTLKKVGFEVHSIPGPPGKREMIRAIKK